MKQKLLPLVLMSFIFSLLMSVESNACELLVKITTPGYVPNGFNSVMYRTRITCSGNVIRGYQLDPFSPWEETTIAQMSQSEVFEVIAKLNGLRSGDLVVPSGPSYGETPTTIYSGHNDLGERVAFFEYSFGQWGKLESYAYADELKRLIDSY